MRITRFAPVLGLALVAAACSSDKGPTTPATTITMTDAEVTQLFTEVGSVFDSLSGIVLNRTANVPNGPLMSIVPGPNFSALGNISGSGPCPAGGTASVSGNAGGTAPTMTFDVTATFSGCKTTNFTVGGSFRETGSINTSTFAGSVTVTGSLSVSTTDGRSGSCGMNFTVTFTSMSATATGTICGRNASGTVA